MDPTALFTHLKIILLQYFQFSVFSFNKISSIQTHPYFFKPLICTYKLNLESITLMTISITHIGEISNTQPWIAGSRYLPKVQSGFRNLPKVQNKQVLPKMQMSPAMIQRLWPHALNYVYENEIIQILYGKLLC